MQLTTLEDHLVYHLGKGALLDLAPNEPTRTITAEAMKTWGKHRQVRADVIRDILLGRLAPSNGPDPRGLQLYGARITEGPLNLTGINTPLPLWLGACYLPEGIWADGCSIPALYLNDSVIHTSPGSSEYGAVSLRGAHIRGELNLTGAKVTNADGPAIWADGIRIEGDAFLLGLNAVSTTGTAKANKKLGPERPPGAIRLLGARINGQFSLTDATVASSNGPALLADKITIGSYTSFSGRFTSRGSSSYATVQLLGAHIGAQLSFQGAQVTNKNGTALAADRIVIDDDAFFCNGFIASGAGPADTTGTVRLTGADIGGDLNIDTTTPEIAKKQNQLWCVDGLTYQGYPSIRFSQKPEADSTNTGSKNKKQPKADPMPGFEIWLKLLTDGTPRYAAQPYQQLATVARAAGYTRHARKALIVQRDDHVKRGNMSFIAQLWARFTKLTLGYGYQPWRALVALLGVWVVSCAMVFLVPDGVERPHIAEPSVSTIPAPLSASCTPTQKLELAVEISFPLAALGTNNPCHSTTSTAGQWLHGTSLVLRLMGWAFAVLFAAGFTQAVRKA